MRKQSKCKCAEQTETQLSPIAQSIPGIEKISTEMKRKTVEPVTAKNKKRSRGGGKGEEKESIS
jgi:hypothetical protein